MEISVVIPAYNEEKVIAKTVEEVYSFLKNKFEDFEIIVVDDNSRDNTLDILQSLPVTIVRNLKNHGKGYTVAKGVKRAKGKWILFMDADNSTSIKELDNFFEYTDHFPVLIASRGLSDSDIKIKQTIFKNILGRLGNLVIRTVLAVNIKDTQCGFKLFSRRTKILFDKMTIDGFAFDFELLFLAKKYGFPTREIPVSWENNFDSSVKWHDYLNTFFQVFKVRLNNFLGKYN